jgi:uncharacterized protein (DUF433 family)
MSNHNPEESGMGNVLSLDGIVWIDSERMGGQPCFYGTRVPIKILFDYIEGGEPLDDFLEGFPDVTREQALAVLEAAKINLLHDLAALKSSSTTIMNWKELVNGLLLKEAESAGFEILLTGDTNINYQQNITGRSI